MHSGSDQRETGVSPASRKQICERSQGRIRVRESQHGLVPDPFNQSPALLQGLAYMLLERDQDGECGFVAKHIRYRAKPREINERYRN